MAPTIARGIRSPLLLLICFLLVPLVATAPTLKHMAFWDNNVTETAAFTTFDFNTADPTALVANKAAGVDSLMDVFWQFVLPTRTGFILKIDWQERWHNCSQQAAPLLANGTIFGFFLGDELVWNGLNMSSLELMVSTVRGDFPSAVIWYNEATPPMRSGRDIYGNQHNYSIPTGLSWISIDMYHTSGPAPHFVPDTVATFYRQNVYPKMTANQLAVLVPGSFGSSHNFICGDTCYDAMCSLDAKQFFAWAINDTRIVAIAPWHWNDCAGCDRFKDEIGTVHTNLTRQAWTDIGKQIKNGTFMLDL